MSDDGLPSTVAVPLASLITLGVEQWRLATWLAANPVASGSTAPARHALRKLEDFLRAHGIEAQSLDGRPFDAGLAARVIDTVEDPKMEAGTSVIEETLSPMILYRGQVVRAAEVVTRRGK